MKKVENCPCCNEPVKIDLYHGFDVSAHKYWNANIRCANCGLYMETRYRNSKKEATDILLSKWNRRA